ncbi:uncharacterized protein LOC134795034 [Cydia splendana]|uniref:uncharacterized protein LOC134795034 n=1 Tax=Cydia splendana TaxID=1100963 RepID=UPI00300C3143
MATLVRLSHCLLPFVVEIVFTYSCKLLTTMASSKPHASVFEEPESSDGEVQVFDSTEPLGTTSSSSSVAFSTSARVLDSIEPLVQELDSDEPLVLSRPTVSIYDDPVPGPSGLAGSSGTAGCSGLARSRGSSASSLEEDFVPASPIAGLSGLAPEDEEELVGAPVPQPTGSSGRRIKPYAEELRNMWNWKKVVLELGTEDQCLQFAEDRGLIPATKMCRIHRNPMAVTKAGKFGKFRCRKSTCRTESVSRAKGTWFDNV